MMFGRADDIVGVNKASGLTWGRAAVAAALLASASFLPAQPASAAALMNGSALSVSGLNIVVANCQLTLGGVAQSDCSAGNLEFIADAGPGASIRIQGAGGGNIFSAALGSGLYDVSFTFNISAINPGTTVNSAALAMFGSATGTLNFPFGALPAASLVSVGETVTPFGGPSQNMNVNLAAATSSSVAFSSVSTLSVVKDLKLNAALPGVGTLTLSHVTQSYQGYLPVPEPATIGLFLLGVGGIAAARSRLRRRRG